MFLSACLMTPFKNVRWSWMQYAQPVCNRHSPTNKLPGELWTWWSRERCFRRWLQTPPSRLPSQPPCPPAQHQNLVPGLPAGDRLFGLDRVALGNPLSHIHKPPRSLMLYVVPEKQRENDRGKEKGQEKRIWRKKKERGGEGRVGVSPPVGSSSESEEDPFVFSTERKGQQWVKYMYICGQVSRLCIL